MLNSGKNIWRNAVFEVYWFTGLSGAGKTTIAKKYAGLMGARLIDADEVREGLCSNLGFSIEDRTENVRRIAELAKMIATETMVVVACISPLKKQRRMAREIIGPEFYEVFVDTPIDNCEERDPKGLYKKVRNGEIKNFTGIDSPYERPESPEFILDGTKPIGENIDILNGAQDE